MTIEKMDPQMDDPGVQEFIDKCTERWLFEKTGVKLYEAALRKCPDEFRDKLQEFRDEEKEHEEMLEEVIRRYGADPHTLTRSARITQLESEGIVKVVENEDFDAVIDALLAAELVDNAKWELLIELAEELDDMDAKNQFEDALDEEEDHLDFVRDQSLQISLNRIENIAA